MRCPVITKKGRECPIRGEEKRNGFCHVHDPNGKFRTQQREKRQARIDSTPIARRCQYVDRVGMRCVHKKHGGKKHLFCKAHKKEIRNRNIADKLKHRAKRRRGDFVYIFSLGYGNLYKIGKSRSPQQRLRSLQAGNPRMSKVMAVEVVNRNRVEKAIHFMFKPNRLEREIFRLLPAELAEVKEVLIGYKT